MSNISKSFKLALACQFFVFLSYLVEIQSFHHAFTTIIGKPLIIPSTKTSSSAHYISSTKKGFGSSSSSSSVGLSEEDKKRKGTIESLEQWARKVGIA